MQKVFLLFPKVLCPPNLAGFYIIPWPDNRKNSRGYKLVRRCEFLHIFASCVHLTPLYTNILACHVWVLTWTENFTPLHFACFSRWSMPVPNNCTGCYNNNNNNNNNYYYYYCLTGCNAPLQWTNGNVLHRDIQPWRWNQLEDQTGEKCIIFCSFFTFSSEMLLSLHVSSWPGHPSDSKNDINTGSALYAGEGWVIFRGVLGSLDGIETE